MEETATYLGGTGRAKLAWDCYRNGIDPVVYFNSQRDMSVERLFAGNRRTQRLGQSVLRKLTPLSDIATLTHQTIASDNTTKLLLTLHDGMEIETVIIPFGTTRSTLCVSSQVGCMQGCVFCATGKMGKLRNLSADEILAQMVHGLGVSRQRRLPPIQCIVFMGMGDAADNAPAVHTAVHQLTTRELFQLAASKVTVSTVAPSPDAFAKFKYSNCALAWSVHAVNDTLRKRLVPTTKHTMKELQKGYIRAIQDRNIQTTMLEIALIKDVNDSQQHAEELAQFAREIDDALPTAKLMVNLIPYNDIGYGYETPKPETVRAYQEVLWRLGLYAHVRTTRGDDQSAACGQLVTKKRKDLLPVDK